ncbi:MAG: hypothetical protein GF364_18790 [Candidatus Lokiarchaeota archaeon]|nr:hypothetical protein [Candidatus Lokiarchaeota archaeon]
MTDKSNETLKWIRNISSALLVISVLELTITTVLFLLVSETSPATLPVNAILHWLIMLVVSLLVFIIVKKQLAATRFEDGKINVRSQNIILKISVIVCGLSTIIPAVWLVVFNLIIYTFEDSLIGIFLSIIAIGAFGIAMVAAWKKTSTFYLFGYFLFNLILFSIFSAFSPIWIVITFLSLLSLNATKRVTSRTRRFMVNFRSKRAQACAIISIIILAIPLSIAFGFMNLYNRTYTLSADNAADEIELNFTWANATPLSDDAYNNLTYADGLSNIEVSLTLPLIYRLQGDYGSDIGEGGLTNVAWDLHLLVEEGFQEIEETPIDQVDTLTYVENGLIENFTKNLTAGGIECDFMPLLPKEEYYMYINDANIERFLKTYAIVREYINRTDLGDKHRGIVIDTEREYSRFDQVITNWWNYGLHETGRELLSDLLKDIRRDQVYWKTGETWENIQAMSDEQIQTEFDLLLENKETHVSCATFQYHLDDFIDWDDEQQHFYEISIIPPVSWDYVGVMTYDKGINSEHNFYGYCRAIDHFFGVNGVPYLYSEDSEENIISKFRIAQNYGYPFIGMWALTSEYCFEDWETQNKWCGGFCDRFGWSALQRLADALSVPEDVTFEFDGKEWYKWTYMHALQLVDLYLVGKPILPTWPLNNAEHIKT